MPIQAEGRTVPKRERNWLELILGADTRKPHEKTERPTGRSSHRESGRSSSENTHSRSSHSNMWREKACPGVYGHTCHNVISYRTDWKNIPTHCESCRLKVFYNPCRIEGCKNEIEVRAHYTNVRDVCGRCHRELERGKQPRLCTKCHSLMFVPKGKDYTVCMDCHQDEEAEKHELLRQSVRGKRMDLFGSTATVFAHVLIRQISNSDPVNFAILDGSFRREWKMPPLKRGERVDGGFDRGNLPYNFPTIDLWDERTGDAISVKSIDVGAKTYRNINAMDGQIKRYIDELANYSGHPRTPRVESIKPEAIRSKTLIIVAPLITSRDYQLNYLYSLPHNQYAQRKGVRILVYIVD